MKTFCDVRSGAQMLCRGGAATLFRSACVLSTLAVIGGNKKHVLLGRELFSAFFSSWRRCEYVF